jgi:DNA-binding CsgD family transcriptional regulator
MRMMLGVDRPTAGSVTVNGMPFAGLYSAMREVGALLDARAVHGGRSAYNHLLCLAQTNDIPRSRVDEVIGIVGLEDVTGKRYKGFSLGMSQRLGIAAACDSVVAPSTTRRLIGRFLPHLPVTGEPPPGLTELTAREGQVLAEVGSGLSNAEIAALLHISEATVKTHVGHIMTKLCLRDRIQAVVYAYETGLVTPQGRATRPMAQ